MGRWRDFQNRASHLRAYCTSLLKAVEDQPRSPLEDDDAEAMIESVGSSEAGRAQAAAQLDEDGAATGLSSHKKRRDVECLRFFTFTTQQRGHIGIELALFVYVLQCKTYTNKDESIPMRLL